MDIVKHNLKKRSNCQSILFFQAIHTQKVNFVEKILNRYHHNFSKINFSALLYLKNSLSTNYPVVIKFVIQHFFTKNLHNPLLQHDSYLFEQNSINYKQTKGDVTHYKTTKISNEILQFASVRQVLRQLLTNQYNKSYSQIFLSEINKVLKKFITLTSLESLEQLNFLTNNLIKKENYKLFVNKNSLKFTHNQLIALSKDYLSNFFNFSNLKDFATHNFLWSSISKMKKNTHLLNCNQNNTYNKLNILAAKNIDHNQVIIDACNKVIFTQISNKADLVHKKNPSNFSAKKSFENKQGVAITSLDKKEKITTTKDTDVSNIIHGKEIINFIETHHLKVLADKVYNLLEHKYAIEKHRRGLH